jgi:hypothetical protein
MVAFLPKSPFAPNWEAPVTVQEQRIFSAEGLKLVGSFRGSNRMPTKLNHEDVAAPQGPTRNLMMAADMIVFMKSVV